jgi:DNA-binding response OmpR family regulator
MKDLTPPEATILLLDSDSVMRAALQDTLRDAGYLVLAADDLGSAVDRLDEVSPDLLIIRPYINSMPGHMAATYLRTKAPGLAVLIVGGFMEEPRVNVQNAIAEYYTFPKPFSRQELLTKVSDVVNIVRRPARPL